MGESNYVTYGGIDRPVTLHLLFLAHIHMQCEYEIESQPAGHVTNFNLQTSFNY